MEINLLQKTDINDSFIETIEALRPVGLPAKDAEPIFHKLAARSMIFVAKENDEVIGTATLLVEQKFIHKGGKVGHIEDVAVRRGHHGKHIGKALIERLVDVAKQQDCYKVILDCDEAVALFYEKCGFHKSAIQMRIDL